MQIFYHFGYELDSRFQLFMYKLKIQYWILFLRTCAFSRTAVKNSLYTYCEVTQLLSAKKPAKIGISCFLGDDCAVLHADLLHYRRACSRAQFKGQFAKRVMQEAHFKDGDPILCFYLAFVSWGSFFLFSFFIFKFISVLDQERNAPK